MKISPKELRIRHQYFHLNLIGGICFIFGGILGFIDSTAVTVFQIAFYAIAVLLLLLLKRLKHEALDEMAEQNMLKARDISLRFLHYFFCICMIATPLIAKALSEHNINWVCIMTWSYSIYIGILEIVQAIAFKQLEDE